MIGDTGTGSPTQYKVAKAMESVCIDLGCEFVLLLGDAIYESGVSGPDDPQFATKFELPYANFSIPFYVVLGNHDYGRSGSAADLTKGQHNVDYSQHSQRWTMPALYYHIAAGPVDLYGLDSGPATARDAPLQHSYIDEQGQWLQQELAVSDAPWRLVFAHHPYISNGVHGDAGHYDGVRGQGGGWKNMLDDVMCGNADFYLSGHDHDLQYLQATSSCDTEFIISGAAAKQRGRGNGNHEAHFEVFNANGFAWMSATNTTMELRFFDADGVQLYRSTSMKGLAN